MPSYKKSIVLSSLLLLLSGCSNKFIDLKTEEIKTNYITVPSKKFDYEDQYIIYALEYESQRLYKNAQTAYWKLFESTNKYEYFIKYLTLSFQLNDYISIKDKTAKYMIEGIKEEETILRLQTFSLMRLNEKKEALVVAKKLLSKFERDVNHELLGSVYLDLKEYEKSVNEFEKSFKLNNASNTLLTLTNIKYYYLNKKSESKQEIEDYLKENGYIYNLSIQLLSFYEKDKEDEKLVKLLKNMYLSYKNGDDESLYLKTKNLLLRYLVKKDINDAVDFFEKNDEDDKTLLELYRSAGQPQKAYALLTKLYNDTKDLDYLAQMAIVEFEMAENKNEVLNSVISKFEKVLTTVDNSVYENYLAYILIDFDKDVKKGLLLVKKALIKQPENLAYLDTLAWGEYKIKDCKNAYTNMKKVVDGAGLEDNEIKFHWEKIKECNK